MRPSGLRSLLFGAFVLIVAGALFGCENPLDPLDKSDKIQGLSYIDVAVTWEAWDSDPEFDGVSVELTYFNEFGDTLSFHDKPHDVVIEFWTQKDIGIEGDSYLVQDELFFSKTIEYSNSEDAIRIPVEAYEDSIPEAAFEAPGGIANLVFAVARIFPPQESPRQELYVAQADVEIFKPIEAEGVPNQ